MRSRRRRCCWPLLFQSGIAFQAGKGYDFSTSSVHTFIWQHGGSIWDETKAPTGHAEGDVNSPKSIEGMEHFLKLLKYMPPVVKTGTMDIFVSDQLFREGKVALNVDWIDGPATNPEQSDWAELADRAAATGQTWAEERYPLYAYYLSRHLPPAKVRAFLDFVVGALAANPM